MTAPMTVWTSRTRVSTAARTRLMTAIPCRYLFFSLYPFASRHFPVVVVGWGLEVLKSPQEKDAFLPFCCALRILTSVIISVPSHAFTAFPYTPPPIRNATRQCQNFLLLARLQFYLCFRAGLRVRTSPGVSRASMSVTVYLSARTRATKVQ